MFFIAAIIGMISFGFLGECFNKMEVRALVSLQEKTRRLLVRKKIYQYSTLGILVVIVLFVTGLTHIGGFLQGFLVGSTWGLTNLIFEDSLFDKLRNNLR